MKKSIAAALFCSAFLNAQSFTLQDSLKGSNTAYRNFWDVKHYEITVEPNFDDQSVAGTNRITFEITKDVTNPVFQIDLQQPMDYKIINSDQKVGNSRRDGDFIFIETNSNYKKGEKHSFTVQFSGKPVIAKNAPWDGGWVFKKDENGHPWMSVAQEGIGASVWLPAKDIWSDEPDEGIVMHIVTSPDLVGVGNGRLISEQLENGKKIYSWKVTNPINTYSIVPNVGKYVNFKEQFAGEKGALDLDYWVLDYNLAKAKKQFQQVKPMLSAFEYWFGPYPFYQDSYKLIETPYLGMEHQSGVGYGNGYANGYLGRDLSATGVGLNWDFIIVHESGHEWFANSITAQDKADMWIHEAFTNYSETLFTERYMDKASAEKYVIGLRHNIRNDRPIIGPYGVAKSGSSDMYYKGSNMLHTIRQMINDDAKFREILRAMNRDFYHQIITSKQMEDYISEKSGLNLSTVFDQYLRTTKVPVLEYEQNGKKLRYRYANAVNGLSLPVRINNGTTTINPRSDWQQLKLKSRAAVTFDPNYYINYQKVN